MDVNYVGANNCRWAPIHPSDRELALALLSGRVFDSGDALIKEYGFILENWPIGIIIGPLSRKTHHIHDINANYCQWTKYGK